MSHSVALVAGETTSRLTVLIEDAANTLTGAHSAAEILDARDKASVAYDLAKRTARLALARDAHNTVIAAAHRAQARALEIEAGAKRRLADEYDAAQERGEVAKAGDNQHNREVVSNSNDLGLSRKAIHEAREIRDAEAAEPGIVGRTLNAAIDAGQEPTRAKLKRAVKRKSKRSRKPRHNPAAALETQHNRDLRMLLGVWEASCASARQAFLQTVNR